MNRKRNLLSALGLALLGTLLLVGYVRAAEGRATAGQRLVPVVVVTDHVDQATSADELRTRVRVDQVAAETRAPGALRSIESIGDRVPATDLYAGEQLLADRLGDAGRVGPELAPGATAVSVSLEAQRALGGQLQSGSRVHVIASFDSPEPHTEIVLRDVLVQGVVEKDGVSGPAGELANLTASNEGQVLVTFALDAAEAERLVNAVDNGRIWLAGADNLALDSGR